MVFVQASALDNEVCGEPNNPEALRKIKVVCLDTSNLDSAVARDVKAFVSEENRPDHLLGRLNWEFVEGCPSADAVIRVYFVSTERYVTEPAPNSGLGVGVSSLGAYKPATRLVLLVYDRASVRVLFRSEGIFPGNKRTAQLKGQFGRLVKEVRRTNHAE